MPTNQDNFRAWYADTLTALSTRREAGFAIMMIALPLLERYLRQRVNLAVQGPLNASFYDELVRFFPEISDRATARQFWHVYRNGLLHEVTLSLQDRSGNQMPVGSLSHDIPGVTRLADGAFNVHPVHFAEKIIQIIENDFATYAGTASASKLPDVTQHPSGLESGTVITSTSAKR